MAELEPLNPADGKAMYLTQRESEVSESTRNAHDYRLKHFIRWCELENIDNLNELTARSIFEYRQWRKQDVDREGLRLWQGSDEGRPSTSEADMAFVKQLYYWCKGDQQLMDGCFRASGRMRPKWDEYRGDHTYGEMTIQKVCRTNSDTFGGRYVERG